MARSRKAEKKKRKKRKKRKKSTDLHFQFSPLGWNALLEQCIDDDGVESLIME